LRDEKKVIKTYSDSEKVLVCGSKKAAREAYVGKLYSNAAKQTTHEIITHAYENRSASITYSNSQKQ
jgi:hypothetical protein